MSDPVTSVRKSGSMQVPRKYLISTYRENTFEVR
jgi:hypothetical protein